MQNLITAISAPKPASYLGKSLSLRYEQTRSRMLNDARGLLLIEYQSCLKLSKSKKLLRRVHDLDHLTRRLRFLITSHGDDITPESFALIVREQNFRLARRELRRLRKWMKGGGRESDGSHTLELEKLNRAMQVGGLTNRDIRTTALEIKRFERRRDQVIEWGRVRYQLKIAARRLRIEEANRSSDNAAN
jgi:hypothetical protein